MKNCVMTRFGFGEKRMDFLFTVIAIVVPLVLVNSCNQWAYYAPPIQIQADSGMAINIQYCIEIAKKNSIRRVKTGTSMVCLMAFRLLEPLSIIRLRERLEIKIKRSLFFRLNKGSILSNSYRSFTYFTLAFLIIILYNKHSKLFQFYTFKQEE
jgi:hypothetical protein